MGSKLIRGTMILTLGTYISKILGLFYVIPFNALVGTSGVALYQYGYVPYTIFISIATAGIPMAVSKTISKYNALDEYAVGRRLFKSGLAIMLVTGFMAFLILFMLAPTLAKLIIPADDLTSNVEDVTAVIRAVSFALIIVPFMSLIRGFFQGHGSMGPSAVSQVVEQIVRIAFLLLGAFIVLQILNGSIVFAVQLATFAAFVGAIGGLAVLFWYWIKRKPHLDALLAQDRGQVQISLSQMYKEIIVSAIPFIIVGIAIPLFQMVDTLTFNKTMASIGFAAQSEAQYAMLNFNSHKIVIIPVSIATAFSLTLVPLITSSFVNENYKDLRLQLNQTFQVLLFLTLPATVGIMILAEPMYSFFYGYNLDGAEILLAYAPVALLFALFSVTAAILQGINRQKFTVFNLLVGLLIKMLLNIPLIEAYQAYGMIYATAIGFGVAIILNLIIIRTYAFYRYRLVFRRSLLILIFNGIMGVVVYFSYKLFALFIPVENQLTALILILLCAAIGGIVYFYLSLKSKLAFFLFPEQMESLKRRLGVS